VEGNPVGGYYDTCWPVGLWSTQAKVESIMLKAALQWVSNSNVVNDPVGEPGCTPLYVGVLCVWGSMDSDHMFSPHFVAEFLKWGL
jgi:hypothetical protein